MLWFFVVPWMLAALLGGYAYFVIKRLLSFYGLSREKSWVKTLNFLAALAVALLCGRIFRVSAIILLHILFVWLFCDIAALLTDKLAGEGFKNGRFGSFLKKLYSCGLLPLALAGSILSYGFFNMGRIHQTCYTVNTSKNTGPCRLLFLSDLHYATVQKPEVFKSKLAELNALQPDIVVLGGDIVDESTSKARMEEIFAILGSLASKYGVYYVYGNHDRQTYSRYKTFSEAELRENIVKNGIKILQNEAVNVNDGIILAGREDIWQSRFSGGARPPIGELLQGADRNKFIIVADHQPADSKENAAAGVDLQVSGHTHAGQIWPMGRILRLFGQLNYGRFQEGGCTVIVSSGAVGWGYPLRTERHCEYVVIDIVLA
ncbi:metallophosphoesterase [bacterium]|nr:metallophosphoesterase [bacterium]